MADTNRTLTIPIAIPKAMKHTSEFKKELTALLNRHGYDTLLGTCDFIIADNIERYIHGIHVMQEKQKRRAYESF